MANVIAVSIKTKSMLSCVCLTLLLTSFGRRYLLGHIAFLSICSVDLRYAVCFPPIKIGLHFHILFGQIHYGNLPVETLMASA